MEIKRRKKRRKQKIENSKSGKDSEWEEKSGEGRR